MRFVATLALALAITPSLSAEQSATMRVSAQVLARAVLDIRSQPAEVVVTAEDVARGYVDVAQPVELHVRTNSRSGYLLQVSNMSETFSSVELAFGDTSMNVAHEGWVTRPYVAGGEHVTAKMRVRLAAGTMTGRHPLPVQLSATAL